MAKSANKVRFGLKKVHRAKLIRKNDGTVEFGDPEAMPGAVSISFNREGSDAKDFYADDGVYYTIAGTNGGYTADLVIARLSADDREALLGETYDSDGVQYETTDDQAPEYAYIMEMQGDFSPIAFCYYCGKASRVNSNANTKGEQVDVDTDTVSIRFIGVDLPFADETKSVIQGHLEKTEENAEKYAEFFESVHTPTFAPAEQVSVTPAKAAAKTTTESK